MPLNIEKLCTKCNICKPVAKFGVSVTRKDGLRPWCKECHNLANKKWRDDNPAYYKNRHEVDPDRRKQYDATYKSKNPAYLKMYYENNRHEFIAKTIKRRAHTKRVTPVWADTNKMRLIYRVAHNLNKLHGYTKYHVDHIIPLKGKLVSGLHVHNNLRVLLAEDNKSKFNRWDV
jgi:hypothetical protein